MSIVDGNVRYHRSITPQEIRKLETTRLRRDQLSQRLKHEVDQIQRLKNQVETLTNRIAQQNGDIIRGQQLEDELKLQFIEAKLEYEYESRKKHKLEQELKQIRKKIKDGQNKNLIEGYRLLRSEYHRMVEESKVELIKEQVDTIVNTVGHLEKDIAVIEDKNTVLDELLRTVCDEFKAL